MRYLLLALLGLSILSGCATYTWVQVEKPADYRFWNKIDRKQVIDMCKGKIPNAVACTKKRGNICETLSIYDKEEAKLYFDPDGLTIFEHENKHCEGWAHQ